MSRLVDVDALLQDFELQNAAYNPHGLWHITGVKSFIENAPTAYDVAKVIEQLEKKRIEVQKMKSNCIALSDKEVCDIENITYDRAKDIVRKGGAE